MLKLAPKGSLSFRPPRSCFAPLALRRTINGLALRSLGEGGAIAQLVERVLCKHEVVGSIPSGSTIASGNRINGDLRRLRLGAPCDPSSPDEE